MTDVFIEKGAKRVFASALDWPGWCRAGKNEEAALEALKASAPRYAVIAKQAGVAFNPKSAGDFAVKERMLGDATTDFGAPGAIARGERSPLKGKEAERTAAIVEAAWAVFDRIVSQAPASLRKGPRGGGRDRDKIVEHVAGAEDMYARKIGIRVSDGAKRRSLLSEAIRSGAAEIPEKGWPVRYAARRIAWHVIDHAWEIEDRSQ